MAGVGAVARRELTRLSWGGVELWAAAILPLVSFALLAALFSRGVPERLPVAVCDLDHSALSRRAARMLDAERSLAVIAVATPADAERRLEEGSVYGAVILPDGLERDVRRGLAPKVLGTYNAAFLLPGSVLRRDLRVAFGTLSAGIELQARQARGESAATAASRLEPIRVERHTLYNPQLSYLTYLLIPLLPAMLQIFVLVTTVWAIGRELREGTAPAWLAAAGGSAIRAVLGKLLPYTAVFVLQLVAMNGLLFTVLGVPLAGSAALVAVAELALVLAVQALGLALAAWFANLRFALSSAAFISGPAFAFSGVTFPTVGMPLVARLWGALLPLTHAVRVLVDQAVRGAPPATAVVPLVALGAFALVLGPLSVPRLARVAADPRHWGRL